MKAITLETNEVDWTFNLGCDASSLLMTAGCYEVSSKCSCASPNVAAVYSFFKGLEPNHFKFFIIIELVCNYEYLVLEWIKGSMISWSRKLWLMVWWLIDLSKLCMYSSFNGDHFCVLIFLQIALFCWRLKLLPS